MPLDFNEDFKKAYDLMDKGSDSLFITGRAGTGKSTLLNYFREHTQKKFVVLAPTGVAAVNVEGQTIHSFFKFKPTVTPVSVKKVKEQKLYKKLETLVIDEISMVRADLLDCVDRFLRLNGKSPDKPFGGVQVIFIGDLYQLPPVVRSQEKKLFAELYESPYFFSSNVFKELKLNFIELEKIYRQKDERFISLLNDIRNKTLEEEGLEELNKRVSAQGQEEEGTLYLTPRNKEALALNETKLESLPGKLFTYSAVVEGDFGKESYPTQETLKVKKGAQIMMVHNDVKGRWVNGTMGKISHITNKGIRVQLENGEEAEVERFTWEIYKYVLKNTQIEAETVGTFTQYPFTLAWALTIHKSQGKTFNKITLDIGSGLFMPGHLYVALSRCTSLDGVHLKKPLKMSHIWLDYGVVRFLTQFQYSLSEEKLSLQKKIDVIKKAIETHNSLEIRYLKANNEKSVRTITPTTVGQMTYQGKKYMGMQGFCHKRREERVFRVDRILEFLHP